MKYAPVMLLLFATLARRTESLFSVRAFSANNILIKHRLFSSYLSAAAAHYDEKAVKRMHDVLRRVRDVNFMPADVKASLIDFRVDGIKLGQVRPNMAKLLCSVDSTDGTNNTPAFGIERDEAISKSFLTLTKACGDSYASRSASVAAVMERLKRDQIITGWRDELYPIAHSFYDEPVFAMERAAVPFLGAIEYGVHINGLLQQHDGTLKMWMARRSSTKSLYPGMLDHIAAGGQPVGLSLMENVVKECFEEAGIPEEIARPGIRPAGAISYERYAPTKDFVVRAFVTNRVAVSVVLTEPVELTFLRPSPFAGTMRPLLLRSVFTGRL